MKVTGASFHCVFSKLEILENFATAFCQKLFFDLEVLFMTLLSFVEVFP